MKKILSLLFACIASLYAVAEDYTLQTLAEPQMAAYRISHASPTQVAAGAKRTVSVTPITGFAFVCWKEGSQIVSSKPSFDFIMPERNVTLVAVLEYAPDAPGNPNPNYYYTDTKTAVIDDFTTGSLLTAYKAVTGSLSDGDVSKLIVRGIVNKNDVSDGTVWLKPVEVDLGNTSGITSLQDLGKNANLSTLRLPDGIEQIDATAFRNTPNVTRLTLMTYAPPTTTAALATYLVPQQVMAIYVPGSSVALYQDHAVWGQYNILPITADVVSISISLPAAAEPKQFEGCHLSLLNVKTGQRLSYVMDGRQQYRFSNILKNSQWRVELTKDRQLVGQKKDIIEVVEDNIEATIDQLTVLHDVTAQVLTPDGRDIAAETTVLFLDNNEGFLGKGVKLTSMPEGMVLKTRVRLTAGQLALYQPAPIQQITVGSASSIITQLVPWNFKQQPMKVEGQGGQPLEGARIYVSQHLTEGLTDRSTTVFTAADGTAQVDVATQAPFIMTVSAEGYVNRTLNLDYNELGGSMQTVALRKAEGTVIGIQAMLHRTPTGQQALQASAATDEQLRSIGYEIYDVTQQRDITEFGTQGDRLQLFETLPVGDVLEVSATLSPVVMKANVAKTRITVQEQTNLSLDLYELGALHADLTTETTGAFMALLFDGNGLFAGSANYQNAKTLNMRQLQAGQYQLVTMPVNRWLTTVSSVDRLQELGYRESIEYVSRFITVEDAQLSTVTVQYEKAAGANNLPQFFAQGTSFEANKEELTVGNYVTLTALFVPNLEGTLTNLQLEVDLPEGCNFVGESALVGATAGAYVLDGRRLIISLPDLQSRVRFCAVPVEPGSYELSALLRCTHVLPSGEEHRCLLPIGSTTILAKSIAFYAPRRVAAPYAYCYGVGPALQTVEVRENDQLLGRTQVGADGKWSLMADLDEERDYYLHAEILDERNADEPRLLKSETRCVNYDKDNLTWSDITIGEGEGSEDIKPIMREYGDDMPVSPKPIFIKYPQPIYGPPYNPVPDPPYMSVPVTGPKAKIVKIKYPRKKKKQELIGVIIFLPPEPPTWPPTCWPPYWPPEMPPVVWEGVIGGPGIINIGDPPPPEYTPDTTVVGDDIIVKIPIVPNDSTPKKQWENLDIYDFTSDDPVTLDSATIDSLYRTPPEPGAGGCLIHIQAIIDPSGYVYEAVSSNRVEGVTTSAYYKQQYEDQYGDVHERTTFWDAWNYGQQNPLYTNQQGIYQWDVPQGQWQVKYEKAGYQTVYSEWLPVPPPQLEVNIPMVRLAAPTVQLVKAWDDYLDLKFSLYMQPQTLHTGNILVTVDGQKVPGRLELLDEEAVSTTDATTYARYVRFWPSDAAAFQGQSALTLTVASQATAYNGFPMEQTFQQEFAIEQRPRSIVAADTLVVDYDTATTLTVQVLPAEAAVGKTLLAQSYATDVAVTDATQYALDGQGRATITVNPLLTGVTRVNYQLAGTDVVAGTIVIVRKPDTTGIDGIVENDGYRHSQAAPQRIYTLSGQLLTAPKRGLNIVDGKIEVVL